MAKKAASTGSRLVKTALRIDFVEGLKPWIELREILRAAGGKADGEVQAGPIVLEDQTKKSRVILQVRGLIIQDEIPTSTRQSYCQMIASAAKIDAVSAFPRAALVRFESIFVKPYESTFVELKEAMTTAFVRENDVTDGSTDIALIFDRREEEILRHTQIGPMQADQLQEQFLKWRLDKTPDIFAFLGLDYERNVEIPFDVSDLGLAPTERGDSEQHGVAGGAVGATLAGQFLLAGDTQPVGVGANRQTWVEIAPGVIVRAERREERFASVELGALQKRMRPEVFAAFVKHIGVVSGREDLDIVEITRPPDER